VVTTARLLAPMGSSAIASAFWVHVRRVSGIPNSLSTASACDAHYFNQFHDVHLPERQPSFAGTFRVPELDRARFRGATPAGPQQRTSSFGVTPWLFKAPLSP